MQCDGMVERLNRTLKSMLCKHAMKFGDQWDRYLSGVLWAYRNTPYKATKEKPSYPLFGSDCRFPTEAAFLPIEHIVYSYILMLRCIKRKSHCLYHQQGNWRLATLGLPKRGTNSSTTNEPPLQGLGSETWC